MLSGCGGSGGADSSNSSDSSSTSFSGVAQLGFISDGTVNLYEKDDLTKIIATTKTSTSTNVDEAGGFTFEDVNIDSSKYYVLEVTGGYDIDSDDDGVIDTSTQIELKGKFYSLIKGKELLTNKVRVTALSDMTFLKLKDELSSLDNAQIQEKLNKNINEYLYDINEDEVVDLKDLALFNPVSDRSKTKKSYSDILNIYIPKLHNDKNESLKIKSLLFIDKPRIVVENGNLQGIPFKLKASIENLPEGIDVKWNLNNIAKTTIDEEINSNGIYTIIASLYKDKELLKIISSKVIATKKIEIASKNIDVSKENTIFITDESNSSLTGTQIVIPKGALQKETKIIVKKLTMNNIPNADGISISDVLVLEPSGLTFGKPVQIKIPYSKSVDIDGKNIFVARYSSDGKLDYIPPLYIDKINREVVFETEHFTEFQLKTSWGITLAKPKQTEIVDIENMTGLNYDLDKWEKILNTNVINDDTTVYDLYLKYKLHKDIIEKMDAKDYKSAYALFLENEDKMKHTGQMWTKMGEIYEKEIDIYDKYLAIESNLKTLFITKKYYSQIASNLGIVTSMNPMEFVTNYTDYVFKQAINILEIADKINKKDAFSLFFRFRENFPSYTFEEILEELEKSKENKQGGLELFGYHGYPIHKGWLGNNYYSSGTLVFQDNVKYYYSLNAIWEIRENFREYSDQEHKDNLKNIIEDIALGIEFEEVSDDKRIKSLDHSNKFIKYKDNENIKLKLRLNTYGYNSNLDMNVEVVDLNNNKLINNINFNCILDEPLLLNNSCSGDIEIDTSKLLNNDTIMLNFYEKNKLVEFNNTYYFHLKKVVKKNISINNISIEPISIGINEDGDFEGRVLVDFSSSLKPIYNVEFKVNNKTYGKEFTILNSEFTNNDLENIEVKISMPDTLKDVYTDFSKSTTINLKEIIQNSINGIVDETKSRLEIIKHNSDNVINKNLEINIDDTITFKLYKNNYIKTINKEFSDKITNYEIVKTDTSNELYDLYTVKFLESGSFSPNVDVELINNKRYKLVAPKIIVEKASTPEPEANSKPVVEAKTYDTKQGVSKNITLVATDKDGDALTYEYSQPKNGKLTGQAPNLVYTPNSGFYGIEKIAFKVNDGKEYSIIKFITINVSKVNNKPSATPNSYSLNQDTSKAITLSGNDLDKDSLTYQITLNPSFGTISGSAPNIVYTPSVDYVGNDSFKFKVYDGKEYSDEVVINLTVNKVIKKYVGFVSETDPKDGSTVQRGSDYSKSWTFKNSGNISLNNLKVKTITAPAGFEVSLVQDIKQTLAVNETTSYKLDFKVPFDLVEGTYKAVSEIQDSTGALKYTNGNIARFSYELKVDKPNDFKAITYTSSSNYSLGEQTFLSTVINDGNEPYSITIDWGDSTSLTNDTISSKGTKKYTHTYSSSGVYIIQSTIKDSFGKTSITNNTVQIIQDSQTTTSWKASAADLVNNTNQENIGIETQNKDTYSIYDTSYQPNSSSDDYWVTYSLAVPKDLIKFTNKFRLTLVNKAGELKDYDRAITLGLSSNKNLSYNFMSDISDEKGFIRKFDFNSATDIKREVSSLTDSAVGVSNNSRAYALQSSYLGTNDNATLSAYKYKDNNYTELSSSSEAVYYKDYLKEIKIQFKGNGTISLLKLEYDKNGDGDFSSDESMILNTNDLNVDWSGLSGIEDDLNFKFTKEELMSYENIYLVFPYDKELITLKFDENIFEANDSDGNNNISYEITQEGYIKFVEPDSNKIAYWKKISKDDERISLAFSYDKEKLASNSDIESYFYFDKTKAEERVKSNPIGYPYTISRSPKAKVVFKDSDNTTNIDVPQDAWIRLVPTTYTQKDEYSKSIECKIQEDGSFENNCFISQDDKEIFDNLLENNNETYQVVVYKNHIKPDERHWNCGEDTYKYAGHISDWSNIVVLQSDFQDRNEDSCDNNEETITTTENFSLATLATGQTKSYQDKDDGYYKKGRARSFTRGNGIVHDNLTGLDWQDDYSDNGGETPSKTWSEAKTYCSNLTLGGYSDWRLPSLKELLSIVDNGKYNSAINSEFENTNSSLYWSSTTIASITGGAWNVNFDDGHDFWHGKSHSKYVRCVRDGQ